MSEGVWLQLDKVSTETYCHDLSGEAWSLARSSTAEIYLRSQDDLEASFTAVPASCETSLPHSFGDVGQISAAAETKGFDFTQAAQNPPVFSAFSNGAQSGLYSYVSML